MLLYDERTFVNETKKYQAFQSVSGDFLPDHPASYRSVRFFDDPGPNQHGGFLLTDRQLCLCRIARTSSFSQPDVFRA